MDYCPLIFTKKFTKCLQNYTIWLYNYRVQRRMDMKASVIGATGYAGVELLRLLDGHPEAEIAVITPYSRSSKRPASTKSPLRWLFSPACCLPRRNGPRPYINFIWPLIWMRLSILSVKTRTGPALTPCRAIYRRR